MMGNNDKPQDEFFYSFNLEDVVPEEHLLRSIDRFLDLSDLREHLRVAVRFRPVVQRADQAVKGQLRSYGCENHFVFSD